MMIKVFVDGVYKEFTPEEYEAQFGGDVEAPRPEPTAEEQRVQFRDDQRTG